MGYQIRWETPLSIENARFREDHLEWAAGVVAARYRAERALEPLLPAAFEEVDAVLPRVRHWLGRGPGVVALREGRPVGFMLSLLSEQHGVKSAWCSDVAHGVAGDQPGSVYRALYNLLGMGESRVRSSCDHPIGA